MLVNWAVFLAITVDQTKVLYFLVFSVWGCENSRSCSHNLLVSPQCDPNFFFPHCFVLVRYKRVTCTYVSFSSTIAVAGIWVGNSQHFRKVKWYLLRLKAILHGLHGLVSIVEFQTCSEAYSIKFFYQS